MINQPIKKDLQAKHNRHCNKGSKSLISRFLRKWLLKPHLTWAAIVYNYRSTNWYFFSFVRCVPHCFLLKVFWQFLNQPLRSYTSSSLIRRPYLARSWCAPRWRWTNSRRNTVRSKNPRACIKKIVDLYILRSIPVLINIKLCQIGFSMPTKCLIRFFEI